VAKEERIQERMDPISAVLEVSEWDMETVAGVVDSSREGRDEEWMCEES